MADRLIVVGVRVQDAESCVRDHVSVLAAYQHAGVPDLDDLVVAGDRIGVQKRSRAVGHAPHLERVVAVWAGVVTVGPGGGPDHSLVLLVPAIYPPLLLVP